MAVNNSGRDDPALAEAEPVARLGPSGFDPARCESFPRLVLTEMETAFEELHGCMIRHPQAVCEVRKEFLSVALCALDDVIRARSRHPLELSAKLHMDADEIEACGAGNEALTMRTAADKLALMYDALAVIEDVWTLPAPKQHPEQQWHCQHDEWLYAAREVASAAIATEARRAETPQSGSVEDEGAGPQDIARKDQS